MIPAQIFSLFSASLQQRCGVHLAEDQLSLPAALDHDKRSRDILGGIFDLARLFAGGEKFSRQVGLARNVEVEYPHDLVGPRDRPFA